MRLISFALTTEQFRGRTKHQTRRLGWAKLKPGDELMGVVKGMGLKKGAKVEKLGPIRVVSAVRERLDSIDYADVFNEGFPDLTPAEFVAMFCGHNGCTPETIVTRIEFRYLDGVVL